MKRNKKQSNDRLIKIGIGVAALAVMVVLAAISTRTGSPDSSETSDSQIIATADPAIIANLTALPQATLIAAPVTDEIRVMEGEIAACEEYSEERRLQMQQHIRWLFHPDEIPPQVALALGTNPAGRLIYGMAFYTSTEWRLNQRPQPSCLIDIGLALNDILLAVGEQALPVYESTDTP